MKVYKTQDIRNVVILGHGGCGKTSLAESMAHVTGVTNRLGRVEDGNTISDYDKEEIKRLQADNCTEESKFHAAVAVCKRDIQSRLLPI